MNYANPTLLRIGMHGEFSGKNFRLVGRVLMGVAIDGENYYWNEYHLEGRDGSMVTLVFEGDGDGGGEWRLFSRFEPEYPMTAADAATKSVGDRLNLNGTDVRVTLVQASHVYYVEGLAPEGVVPGSTANYFNAEADEVMQVVSWTGEEVEYYNGCTLERAAVEHAFRIVSVMPPKIFGGYADGSFGNSNNTKSMSSFLVQAGLLLTFVFILFALCSGSCTGTREAGPVKRISAEAPPLPVGATGLWNGKILRITAHTVMEIDKVGAIYGRNEYLLADDVGKQLLLICDDTRGGKNWTLFSQMDLLVPPKPVEAGAQKIGDIVNIDGIIATVGDIYESAVQSVDDIGISNPLTGASPLAGEVTYNYLARSQYETILVRWNNSGIACYEGKAVPAKAFASAFSTANKP